jgi:hypothetical protein
MKTYYYYKIFQCANGRNKKRNMLQKVNSLKHFQILISQIFNFRKQFQTDLSKTGRIVK